jgi:protein TonB
MTFQALLFCPDEKTARVTTQVLTELEFSVEACSEPFAAVKKLMGQHFDAIVVDCENEQNATLLFKSARNSNSNQGSLSVAVVEGQTGVANAFRIGANLVLTKPINVEQAKSTLRVARGLLRKGTEGGKPAVPATPSVSAPNVATPSQAVNSLPAQPTRPPLASIPTPMVPPEAPRPAVPVTPKAMPAVASAAKTEPVATSLPEPTAAPMVTGAMPTSRPSTLPPRPAGGAVLSPTASGKNPLQKPALSPTTSGKVPVFPPQPPAIPSGMAMSGGAASAPAPAKESPKPLAPTFEEEPGRSDFQKSKEAAIRENLFAASAQDVGTAPTFGALDTDSHADEGGGSKKAIIFVLVFLVVAAGGYFGYTKISSKKTGSASPAIPPQSQQATPDMNSVPSSTTPSAVVTPPAPAAHNEIETPSRASAPAAKQPEAEPEQEVVVTHPAQEKALAVKSDVGARAAQRQPEATTAEVSAPPVLGSGEAAQPTAISGIVQSTPAALPKVATETLRISQGVTDGLLIKKVPPAYPRQAIQMRVQGAVQLQAVIDKQGRITSVQVVKGDSILARAAVEAVKQWRYKPYFLDGQPVDIQTQITVNFKLP